MKTGETNNKYMSKFKVAIIFDVEAKDDFEAVENIKNMWQAQGWTKEVSIEDLG